MDLTYPMNKKYAANCRYVHFTPPFPTADALSKPLSKPLSLPLPPSQKSTNPSYIPRVPKGDFRF